MPNVQYTVGLSGGSGSGKTFLLEAMAKCFSSQEVCVLSQDNYYKPKSEQQKDERGIENFDIPEAIAWAEFQADILRVKRGESLAKTEYTFNNPSRLAKSIQIVPAPILIIEGLFVQYIPEIKSELDLKIFVDAPEHIKLSRRILRDHAERGYDVQDVLYRYENHVMPVFEKLIAPLRESADIVIFNNGNIAASIDLITSGLRTKMKAR